MNKRIASSIITALIIAGSTSLTAVAAMANGTVVIGNKAFDLGYANDQANAVEISNAIVAGGVVYVKDFNGIWINNITGEHVEAKTIPAVLYKSAGGGSSFDVGDKDYVTKLSVQSVGVINTVNASYGSIVANVALPSKVTLKLSDNTTRDVSVSWTSPNYDGTRSASYIFTGTYILPSDVTGAMPAITVNVVVGVKPSLADIAAIKAAETAVKAAELSRMDVDVTTANGFIQAVNDIATKTGFNDRIAKINVLSEVVSKGNNTLILTDYNTSLNDLVDEEMKNTPAASIDGQWRYAAMKDGQPGYCLNPSQLNDTWVYSPENYNIIRNQLINNIDPLNLEKDSVKVYQFVRLNYIECTNADNLNLMFGSNNALSGKGQVFIDAAKQNNINPIYLAAHAILETGHGTSLLANGGTKEITGEYTYGTPVYNLFGICAFDGAPDAMGTSTAYQKGWTSVDLAIFGGAAWISKGYISDYQDTLYKMRWNPLDIHHQYATDVSWVDSQIKAIKKCFDLFPDAMLTFDIPVFK